MSASGANEAGDVAGHGSGFIARDAVCSQEIPPDVCAYSGGAIQLNADYLVYSMHHMPEASACYYVGLLYVPSGEGPSPAQEAYMTAGLSSLEAYIENNEAPYNLQQSALSVWVRFRSFPRCLLVAGNFTYMFVGSETGHIIQSYVHAAPEHLFGIVVLP